MEMNLPRCGKQGVHQSRTIEERERASNLVHGDKKKIAAEIEVREGRS